MVIKRGQNKISRPLTACTIFVGRQDLPFPIILVLPPTLACARLADPCPQMLHQDSAFTTSAIRPRSNQVAIEAGMIRFEFGCSQELIPWKFDVEFAARARDAIKVGFERVWAWRIHERTGDNCRIFSGPLI